jgi:hypothetical protein
MGMTAGGCSKVQLQVEEHPDHSASSVTADTDGPSSSRQARVKLASSSRQARVNSTSDPKPNQNKTSQASRSHLLMVYNRLSQPTPLISPTLLPAPSSPAASSPPFPPFSVSIPEHTERRRTAEVTRRYRSPRGARTSTRRRERCT